MPVVPTLSDPGGGAALTHTQSHSPRHPSTGPVALAGRWEQRQPRQPPASAEPARIGVKYFTPIRAGSAPILRANPPRRVSGSGLGLGLASHPTKVI